MGTRSSPRLPFHADPSPPLIPIFTESLRFLHLLNLYRSFLLNSILLLPYLSLYIYIYISSLKKEKEKEGGGDRGILRADESFVRDGYSKFRWKYDDWKV